MDEEYTRVEPWLQALGRGRKTQFTVYITNKKSFVKIQDFVKSKPVRDFTIKRWGSLRILGSACNLSENLSLQQQQSHSLNPPTQRPLGNISEPPQIKAPQGLCRMTIEEVGE